MNLPAPGEDFRKENMYFSTLKVFANPVPDLTVRFTGGGFYLNSKKYVSTTGGKTSTFTVPSSGAKLVLVCLNSNGFVQLEEGAASADPTLPNCPRNCYPMGVVYVKAGATAITQDMIFRVDGVYSTSIYNHADLDNKDGVNSHPISAITNLQSELDARPTSEDLSNTLESKADISGTPSEKFILNKDFSGTAISLVELAVNRGNNLEVGIRWNESNNDWEYSKDGSTWSSLTDGGGYVHPSTHSASMITTDSTHLFFTQVEKDKLATIEDSATADMSASEIKSAYESNSNTNAYTDTEKTKLAGLSNYEHPATHSASMISEFTDKKFMTDDEKTKLAGIAEGATNYSHPSTHPASMITEDTDKKFMLDAERLKLAGIQSQANLYVHPDTHNASIIVEETDKKFMTDAERTKLAGIAEGATNYSHPSNHPASFVAFSPTTSTDWVSVPADVFAALNELASRIKALEP